MYFRDQETIYKHALEHKLNYVHKHRLNHVPRYWVLVIWVLFITLVIYAYSVSVLIDLEQNNLSIEQSIQNTTLKHKVTTTLEFLPNEPVPQLAPMPAF